MSNSVATPWQPFDAGDHTIPVELLGQIMGRTADAWVMMEPIVAAPPKKRFLGKEPKAPYSVLVVPYATSTPPEITIHASFPDGPVFSARTSFALPAWATLNIDEDEYADIDMSIIVPLPDVIALAIAAVRASSATPLGDAWRTCLGDNHIAYRH
jgi:hypothetical protein